MAQNNEDFRDILFKRVEFMFPRLKDTFRFNSATKRSEQCAPTVANAAWSLGIRMPKDEAKKFHAEMKAHYEDCRKRNSKLPEFTKVFGMKKDDETNTVTFEAKKRGVTSAGKTNQPPTVIDGGKNMMTGDKLDIWSGSLGNVKVRAFPAVDPEGHGGISLLLDTVQVVKAVYGGSRLDDFDVEEMEESDTHAPDVDPFAAAAERKASKPTDLADEF